MSVGSAIGTLPLPPEPNGASFRIRRSGSWLSIEWRRHSAQAREGSYPPRPFLIEIGRQDALEGNEESGPALR
jgi:hypothetical protein